MACSRPSCDCSEFVPNLFRRRLCSECFHPVDEHTNVAHAAVNLVDEQRFLDAARSGDLLILDEQIHAGVPVNAITAEGDGALHVACLNGHVSAVQFLLQFARGVDVNLRNPAGWTPLMVAAGNNSIACVQSLVKAGADIQLQRGNGWTALFEAVRYGHLRIAQYLVAMGAQTSPGGVDVLSIRSFGATPSRIRAAIERGRSPDGAEIVEELEGDIMAPPSAEHSDPANWKLLMRTMAGEGNNLPDSPREPMPVVAEEGNDDSDPPEQPPQLVGLEDSTEPGGGPPADQGEADDEATSQRRVKHKKLLSKYVPKAKKRVEHPVDVPSAHPSAGSNGKAKKAKKPRVSKAMALLNRLGITQLATEQQQGEDEPPAPAPAPKKRMSKAMAMLQRMGIDASPKKNPSASPPPEQPEPEPAAEPAASSPVKRRVSKAMAMLQRMGISVAKVPAEQPVPHPEPVPVAVVNAEPGAEDGGGSDDDEDECEFESEHERVMYDMYVASTRQRLMTITEESFVSLLGEEGEWEEASSDDPLEDDDDDEGSTEEDEAE